MKDSGATSGAPLLFFCAVSAALTQLVVDLVQTAHTRIPILFPSPQPLMLPVVWFPWLFVRVLPLFAVYAMRRDAGRSLAAASGCVLGHVFAAGFLDVFARILYSVPGPVGFPAVWPGVAVLAIA